MGASILTISPIWIYFLTSIIILVVIAVVAIANAEECQHPAECFNCSHTSCSECEFVVFEKHVAPSGYRKPEAVYQSKTNQPEPIQPMARGFSRGSTSFANSMESVDSQYYKTTT